MHYYPFNLKDYLVETAHLPPLADLAYRRLLDLYYKKEAPIPNKPKWVANRIRLDGEEVLIGFVLREYFRIEGEGDTAVWRHDYADEVIAKYQKKAATARENGKGHVAGTVSKRKKPKSDADSLLTNNHKPIRNTPLPPEGVDLFDTFWKRYPNKANKPKAVKAFRSAMGYGSQPARCTFEELMAGLTVHLGCEKWVKDRGEYVPYASTWLNGDRWNDRPTQHEAGSGGKDGADKGWWETRQGLMDRAVGLGVPPPAEDTPQAFLRFKAHVWLRAGDGPWWDAKDTAYALAVRLRDEGGTTT